MVAPLAFGRSGRVRSTSLVWLSDAENAEFDRHIDAGAEIVAVRRFVGPLTGAKDVTVDEFHNSDDDIDKRRIAWTWALGEKVLIDENALDADQRVHTLVDAKRPDLEGRVPLGGPY